MLKAYGQTLITQLVEEATGVLHAIEAYKKRKKETESS
jgi:hypothetical protein